MAFTYDVLTDRGKVRMLITDRDSTYPMFDDSEIDAFLALSGLSILLAAAMALETIGSNEVLVQKVIKLLDLQTDGSAVSRELRMRAQELRGQAKTEGQTFDWAEMVFDQATYLERIEKEALRE